MKEFNRQTQLTNLKWRQNGWEVYGTGIEFRNHKSLRKSSQLIEMKMNRRGLGEEEHPD